jgi:DASS family divalent anion:Na+ symporter
MPFAMTHVSTLAHAHRCVGSAQGAGSIRSPIPAVAASSVPGSFSAPFAGAKKSRRANARVTARRARVPLTISRDDDTRADAIVANANANACVVLANTDETDDGSEGASTVSRSEKDPNTCDVNDEAELIGVPPRAIDANEIDYRMMAVSVAVGLAIRFLVPVPEDLSIRAWTLFAIFASTVTGLVVKPAPVGAWAFFALTLTVTTKTLTFQEGLAALTNEVIWLIVVASFFARAFIKTGFGDRLGLYFVKLFGHTTLRLAYGLQCAEAFLSPAMPSTTARAAGVFVPVINSLDVRTRGYLMGQQLQGANVTSTLLLSAAAQNFLCMQIAQAQGIAFRNVFVDWFVAASVPTLLSMLVTPLVMYVIDPPGLKETPEAPIAAAERLKEMGPLRGNEAKMCFGLGITVAMWIFGPQIGISAAVAAMIGLCVLILLGVLTWNDALEQKGAWDTLLWFSILISMSGQLNQLGVVGHFASAVSEALAAAHMTWLQAFGTLHFGYFIMHYFFASQSAHVGALYPAFLTMLIASGCPPTLAALSLAFNTNLFGGLTHYASGQSAVFFGSGAIPLPTLWKQGAYVSVVNIAIFGTVGMAWWRVLGLW